MRRLRDLLLFTAITVCIACGPTLSSAKSDFRGGRLPEAKEKLVALEGESRSWAAPRDRAEYALYRGLVHHALGDREAAAAWLRDAKALDDAHPKALSEDDHTRLELALDALGRTVP